MTLSEKEFGALCEQHNLGPHAAALQPWLRPRIGYSRSGDVIARLGASRIGGGPDVPPGFEWPTHNGRPLDFMLQINLADLQGLASELDLPADGVLALFYDAEEQPWGFDPSDRTGHRVYVFSDGNLRRLDAPHPDTALPPSSLAFHRSWSLPHPYSDDCEAMLETLKATGIDLDEEDYEALAEALGQYGGPVPGHRHALGGYQQNIQGDMKLEAQLVSHGISCGDPDGYEDPRRAELEDGAQDWTLLLQLDSDDDAMWGDAGMLYLWIRKQDLAARDVSRTWLSLQCY